MFCSVKQCRALKECSSPKESKPVMEECLLHAMLLTPHLPNPIPNRPAKGKPMSCPMPYPIHVPNQMLLPTVRPMPVLMLKCCTTCLPNQGVEKLQKGQWSKSNLAKDQWESSASSQLMDTSNSAELSTSQSNDNRHALQSWCHLTTAN